MSELKLDDVIRFISQADIEDNVTTWDDTVYFRKWEQKIINHINSEEDQNNGFNQFNDDDNVCKVELNEDDKVIVKPVN